ncbi:MAG TPA: RNA methyltransferase [Thermoplasmata archaeon]|nr:RNA methyltransferase [Thermoplasmata archaeon]
MPCIRIVLVEPLHDGNVGAIARAMKNFGLQELVLVRPCAVGEEAVKRSMHAVDVLKSARTVFTEEEALEGVDYVVATSGIDTSNDKKFPRISMVPEAFAEKLKDFDGTVAILFGREDFGLDNDLVKRCDFLVTIPANPLYPIMNISHAAAVLFYVLHSRDAVRPGPKRASEMEVGRLNEYFSRLLDVIDYPEYKKVKTCVMFRRLMARAMPSTWEFHTLMGILDGAIDAGESAAERDESKE